jgi:hypothetical protein
MATSRAGDAGLYPPAAGAPMTAIYVVDNGWHSDLGLPRAALIGDPLLGRAVAQATDKDWVMVGWGDARFYRESGVSVARGVDGLRALFEPGNASVVHLQGVSIRPDMAFVDAKSTVIEVSDAGMARLVARIDASLASDRGAAIRAPGAAGQDEAFLDGDEPFSLIHLCNHSTGEALNAAGLPVSLALDTLPAGLRLDLQLRRWLSGVASPVASGARAGVSGRG